MHEKRSVDDLVRANVRRRRKALGLSARQLGLLLEDLGSGVSQQAISAIENRGRRVSASELLELAIALDTAPVDLLLPVAGDSEPVLVGGTEIGGPDYRSLVTGGLPDMPGEGGEISTWVDWEGWGPWVIGFVVDAINDALGEAIANAAPDISADVNRRVMARFELEEGAD